MKVLNKKVEGYKIREAKEEENFQTH